MNKYNPQIHHRRSIRLKGYDYTQHGLYFITICVHNQKCLFGNIVVGADPCVCPQCSDPIIHPEMILNDAGQMIEKWYHKIEDKFTDIRCHEMIVMPNHFHCIIENTGTNTDFVGADQCVCLKNNNPCVCPGEHTGSPLHCVVQWFKTMTTNEYIRGVKNKNWSSFDGKLWQRDYWEHIIRNNKSHQIISEYIVNNPIKWAEDDLYNI